MDIEFDMNLYNELWVEPEKERQQNREAREEKFRIIKSRRASEEVVNYVFNQIATLEFEISRDKSFAAWILVKNNRLEGLAWEATQSMAPFFPNAKVIRGNLIFREGKKYPHAWIGFEYNGEEYVFDPCFNFVCLKSVYDEVFIPEVIAIINTDDIHRALCDEIQKPTIEQQNEFLDVFSDIFKNIPDQGKTVKGSPKMDAIFYNTIIGYKAKIENNKILSLKAHIFDSD